jgi:hypothetical protein
MNAEKSPTLPATTMSMPFIEMLQRNDASPSITSKPPCPEAPAATEAKPFTHAPRHHVFGDRGSRISVYGYARVLVHAARVISGVPFDCDVDGRVDAHCDAVGAVRIPDPHVQFAFGQLVMPKMIELPKRPRREVERHARHK